MILPVTAGALFSITALPCFLVHFSTKWKFSRCFIPSGKSEAFFDVKIGNVWLTREACEDIAARLGIKIVPLIGEMSIPEAIEFVKVGFKSRIAENKDYDAEGLVLKAPLGLLDRRGERIITKIKTCDFRQRDAKEKTV